MTSSIYAIDYERFTVEGSMKIGISTVDNLFIGTDWHLCSICNLLHLDEPEVYQGEEKLKVGDWTAYDIWIQQ